MKHNSRKTRFEALLRPHFDALYAAARRMTRVSADAEDLVQEVAIKAFERLEELERMEYPRAWLLRVMYNKFIDTQRSEDRSPMSQAATGETSAEPDEHGRSDWLPEESLDREIRITRILMAMKRLDSEAASLVALRDIEGLTIAELEKLTGSPAGTIKAQLHRTRARLGRMLANDPALKPELKAVGSDNDL